MKSKKSSIPKVIKELWRKKKFIPIILALSFMVFSITMMVVPSPHFGLMIYPAEFSTDMTGVKWTVGPILFLLSFYFIIKVVKSDYEIIYCKCVSCGEIITADISKKPKCLVCAGKLERLEGFFERHPENEKGDN